MPNPKAIKELGTVAEKATKLIPRGASARVVKDTVSPETKAVWDLAKRHMSEAYEGSPIILKKGMYDPFFELGQRGPDYEVLTNGLQRLVQTEGIPSEEAFLNLYNSSYDWSESPQAINNLVDVMKARYVLMNAPRPSLSSLISPLYENGFRRIGPHDLRSYTLPLKDRFGRILYEPTSHGGVRQIASYGGEFVFPNYEVIAKQTGLRPTSTVQLNMIPSFNDPREVVDLRSPTGKVNIRVDDYVPLKSINKVLRGFSNGTVISPSGRAVLPSDLFANASDADKMAFLVSGRVNGPISHTGMPMSSWVAKQFDQGWREYVLTQAPLERISGINGVKKLWRDILRDERGKALIDDYGNVKMGKIVHSSLPEEFEAIPENGKYGGWDFQRMTKDPYVNGGVNKLDPEKIRAFNEAIGDKFNIHVDENTGEAKALAMIKLWRRGGKTLKLIPRNINLK